MNEIPTVAVAPIPAPNRARIHENAIKRVTG